MLNMGESISIFFPVPSLNCNNKEVRDVLTELTRATNMRI